MFALLAFVDFLIALILKLVKTDTGDFDLLYLGLALFAFHFVWGVGLPAIGTRRDREPR